MHPDRDPERLLRAAFEDRAARVEVSPDALDRIRARLPRRRSWLLGVSALAATLAASAGVALALSGGPPITVTPTPLVTSAVVPSVPVTSAPVTAGPTTPPPTSAPTATPGAVVRRQVPVYFVGTVAGKPVLYREFHTLDAGDGSLPAQVRAAVAAALAGRADDTDYTSHWGTTTVHSVQIAGSSATVDISRPGGTPTADRARVSVQQVVWTVTAAAPDVDSVRITVDGQPATTLWNVDISRPLTRADHTTVLAPVWLYEPQEGATVGRTFTVLFDGTVYEASAVLRVLDGSGAVVREQPVQLDQGPPARGQATVPLTLPPGRYVLQGFYFSPENGQMVGLDDHRVTVR